MSEQSQGTWLTQEAYDRLSAELEHRKTTERKETPSEWRRPVRRVT